MVEHRLSSVVADDQFSFPTFTSISKWRSYQLSSREILKVICVLKPAIQSGDTCILLVLFGSKYQVVSFRTQNKTLILSAATFIRKTVPFYTARARPDLFVFIVFFQFVNYAIALKFCDNTCNSMTFPPI